MIESKIKPNMYTRIQYCVNRNLFIDSQKKNIKLATLRLI